MVNPLRHDEQADEQFYDHRPEADDDQGKGQIRFPDNRLFGREQELKKMIKIFSAAEKFPDFTTGNDEQPTGRAIFVQGFSGSGKSSLIHGLIRELQKNSIQHFYAKGKYNEHDSVVPCSAINQAMTTLVADLLADPNSIALDNVRSELGDSENFSDGISRQLLTILPCLCPLFSFQELCIKHTYDTTVLRTDLKTISYIFADFMRILCRTIGRPLILFLDDLQWADITSLDLLEPFLSTLAVDNFLFIGGFRSNEVMADHPLSKQIELLLNGSIRERFSQMEVSNLSLEDVTEFVAETLQLKEESVGQLAEAIFCRTLGNIFFCRQAIEELVRKNAIYYDVMTFRWEFNLSGVDLNLLLRGNVVEMIQSKLMSLPPSIQKVLTVASYIRNIIEETVLLECLGAHGVDMSRSQLDDALNVATTKGLLLKSCRSNRYKFSHDKVKEAAYTSVSRSEKRHRLKSIIASVLFRRCAMEQPDQEWMVFVAAEYFGSIPKSLVKEDSVQLAKLFLRVAELSASKGSFEKASWYLNRGVDFLRLNESMWKDHYNVCVSLFNQLIMIEFARGDMDGTKAAIDEVIWNGHSLKDTCVAYHTKVAMTVKSNSRNYIMGANESIKLLEAHGQYIPTNPSKIEILVEHTQMMLALRGRRISDMAKLPLAEDDSLMKLMFQLCHLLSLAHNHSLNRFVTMRAIRLSLEKGITKYMSEILMTYTIPLRIAGKLNLAYSYATVVSSIYERFPEDRGAEYARAQMVLYVGIVPLKIRFSEGIDALYSSYGLALSCGDVDTALVSAMLLPMHYHASSLPLNSMMETKLRLFEEKSKLYHQPSYTAIFQCCRQFQFNLITPSENPTILQGCVMDEDTILAELEGNNKSMTIRDFSMFRMVLGVIFNNEETMEQMMARLEDYPYFDLPVVRMHLRLLFHGLASLLLGRRKKRKEYTRKGLEMMQEFKNLAQIGSENAQPAYKCFQAIYYHKKSYYDEAIAACSSMKLTHLEAVMNEHCGFMFQEQGNSKFAELHIGKAFWLYYDWGAFAKVESMKKQFSFLAKTLRNDKTERSTLSVFLHQATTSVADSVGATSEDPFQLRHRYR